MMPNVAGNRSTQNQILAYSLLLAPIGFLPYAMDFAGPVYGVVSAILGVAFIWFAFNVWQMDSQDTKMVPAKKLFAFSILYLFSLFAVLILEVALPSIGSMFG